MQIRLFGVCKVAYRACCNCKTHEDFRKVNQTVAFLYLINLYHACSNISNVATILLSTLNFAFGAVSLDV